MDELISQLGYARSISGHTDVALLIKNIQQDLFRVAAAIGTPPDAREQAPEITREMVQGLEEQIGRIEAIPGIPGDWSIPGESASSAALDVGRTVCRRAERVAVKVSESGGLPPGSALAYLNRLSDLLWLLGRLVEHRQGADASLRSKDQAGKRWSRAW